MGCRGYFFFQAEDGIRGLTVTGVQTCALPISAEGVGRVLPMARKAWSDGHRHQWYQRRSEERRVGKSVELGGSRSTKKKRKCTTLLRTRLRHPANNPIPAE